MKEYNKKHIGEKFITNEGYEVKIIGGGSKANHNIIQIEDWIVEAYYSNIKNGEIKYPYHSSVFNVGCIGEGKHKTIVNGKNTKAYYIWNSMVQRCYSKKGQLKNPTYVGVTVYKEWHNFQNFAEWFDKHYIDGYELDKDLLSEPDNKIYSPETCLFIPRGLNSFLANKYTNNKSGRIGVSWKKPNKKWVSNIRIDGKTKYLGLFDDIEDAVKAYKEARQIQAMIWQDRMIGILPDAAVKKIREGGK